jgi:hypothetical protein
MKKNIYYIQIGKMSTAVDNENMFAVFQDMDPDQDTYRNPETKGQLKDLPPSTRPVCMSNDGDKCANCYYYFAPCLNCAREFKEPNSDMTWNELRTVMHIRTSYAKFCKKSEKIISKVENMKHDSCDSPRECWGPYSENLSRCFGDCCN